ncbi:MAG: DUF393 domain-containing protein [Candidatus Latescibacterota bacterium]|nr:DUF393 domain-containing protein [Candidatus Latescibacterota bacterium]
MPTAARLQLLYDPDCDLCLQFQETVGGWDRQGTIERIPLDDASLAERLTAAQLEAARAELTVIDRRGNLHHGIQALRRLTEALPALKRVSWAYRLPGVTPIVNKIYRAVSSRRRTNRPCLNCGEKWMPSMKWSRRGRR